MKKKTTQTKMEKRFFLLIAILALIAIGVVAYGVGSTLTSGNHVKNTDSGTEEATDEISDSGENDPLAIHSIIIGDTEASILHNTIDGADDYITKPFNILEVKARIKAIMRRAARQEPKEEKAKVVQVKDLRIDCEGRRVFIGDREINLTAKEFDVLELLVFNPNKVYSRENLLNIVWGYEYPGDVRTVDVHIRRLREKIEKNPSEPKYVHTKWGVGYYFQA